MARAKTQTMTGEELRAALTKPKRRNKYGARKALYVDHTGMTISCDSQAERAYYVELDQRVQVGAILSWLFGPNVVLQAKPLITYRPDAMVLLHDGTWQAVDVKGVQTAAFRIKAKLWQARYPAIPLVLVRNGREEPA